MIRLGIEVVLMFGDARVDDRSIALMQNIADFGTLKAATSAMEMHQHSAKVLLAKIGQAIGASVVRVEIGGEYGGSTTLTPAGASLLSTYRELQKTISESALPHLSALLKECASPPTLGRNDSSPRS